MKFIERETFCICGYAVETTAAQNDRDVSGLYKYISWRYHVR